MEQFQPADVRQSADRGQRCAAPPPDPERGSLLVAAQPARPTRKASRKNVYSPYCRPRMGAEPKCSKAPACEANQSSSAGAADTSLSLLTRKFMQLLRNATPNDLDLNIAADELGVQKRRVYDITNVLQGLGYVTKSKKNQIRWLGPDFSRLMVPLPVPPSPPDSDEIHRRGERETPPLKSADGRRSPTSQESVAGNSEGSVRRKGYQPATGSVTGGLRRSLLRPPCSPSWLANFSSELDRADAFSRASTSSHKGAPLGTTVGSGYGHSSSGMVSSGNAMAASPEEGNLLRSRPFSHNYVSSDLTATQRGLQQSFASPNETFWTGHRPPPTNPAAPARTFYSATSLDYASHYDLFTASAAAAPDIRHSPMSSVSEGRGGADGLLEGAYVCTGTCCRERRQYSSASDSYETSRSATVELSDMLPVSSFVPDASFAGAAGMHFPHVDDPSLTSSPGCVSIAPESGASTVGQGQSPEAPGQYGRSLPREDVSGRGDTPVEALRKECERLLEIRADLRRYVLHEKHQDEPSCPTDSVGECHSVKSPVDKPRPSRLQDAPPWRPDVSCPARPASSVGPLSEQQWEGDVFQTMPIL